MSWQLATFAGLALALVAGFAWYERGRPPARIVALVAALAALAVAGRLFLAPFPNVVATTDVALLTGYALGPGPGFAVGALAAPISNIWLGQGPWTAWEMAGWGLAGLGGAALAFAAGRRLGRLWLAAACGLAGLAYGALLDLSVMVTYGGEQSLDRYLALSARGIPFNVAHAAGNFAIAFAAGPALVRLISRYRTRFEFSWRPSPATGALVLALALGTAGLAGWGERASAASGDAGAARAYLERSKSDNGGYAATPGTRSSPAMTGWAMLGLEAAGRNPLDLGRPNPVAFLRKRVKRLRSVGDLERTILALDAAGRNAQRFGGRDLVAKLRSRRSSDGSFQGQVNLTAFGILALRAAGSSAGELSGSAGWLREAQNDDGGWGFGLSARSDPDSTGAALQGLAAAGSRSPLPDGVRYLRGSQKPEGGWGLNETGATNTQSTAWAVQGLVAAGVRPARVKRSGRSPLDYLAARRAPDGHYSYSAGSDQTPIWVTAQAVVAAKKKAFPLDPVPRKRRSGGGAGKDSQGEGGSGGGGAAGITGSALGGGVPSSPPPAPTPSPSPLGDLLDGGSGGPGGDKASGGSAKPAPGDRGPEGGRPITEDEPGPAVGALIDTLAGEAGEFLTASGEAPTAEEDDGPGAALYAGGGLGLLGAGLVGGFFWYRRRLE